MAPQKYAGLIERILSDKNEDRKRVRLEKFFERIKGLDIDTSSYATVRFYKTVRSTLPEKYKDEAISRELLSELKL